MVVNRRGGWVWVGDGYWGVLMKSQKSVVNKVATMNHSNA